MTTSKSITPTPSRTILVIVGVTGDLSRRKLLPAIEQIMAAEPKRQLQVVGISRRTMAATKVLAGAAADTPFLTHNLRMYQMNLSDAADYAGLATYLNTLEADAAGNTQRIFYLSVPPQVSGPIIQQLGESGLAAHANTKLLLEKPFGQDLASAQDLVTETTAAFREDQIYRIDHYLAKEMSQNLVVFRRGNSLFAHTWNRDFIERIEIVASETIGIEGRGEFYEQTGALRDIVQSHLLQLAALTLAELPPPGDWDNLPAARLEALRHLSVVRDTHPPVRGQYAGYREEAGNPHSQVETFVSLTLESSDPRWQGVPIQLVTGKNLAHKTTEIKLFYRQTHAEESNVLTLKIQPDEGIELCLWVKEPGYERKLQKLPLSFAYAAHFDALPEAYERVLVDAMGSDHNLFTTSAEVLETWRILEPVQQAWAMSGDDLIVYEPGTEAHSIQLTKPHE